MATTIVTKKGSGAPAASDLVEGELAVDTTNGRLYTENSSAAVVELGSNPSGNITFGDNGKAIFGAGSDLQIYHDGSNSRIHDAGTGVLLLQTDGTGVQIKSDGSESIADFNKNGGVNLYYDNSAKLATTATGIDVTGSVTADELTVTGTLGNWSIDSQGAVQTFTRNSTSYIRASDASGALRFDTGGSNARLNIAANGDISFYNDAGTSQALFWDASAESLGIGTSSPTGGNLHVAGSTDSTVRVEATSGNDASLFLTEAGTGNVGAQLVYDGGDNKLYFKVGNNTDLTRMTIDRDTGSVGIGVDLPARPLHVSTSGVIPLRLTSTGTDCQIELGNSGGTPIIGSFNDQLIFNTASAERLRIDASGNFLVGNTIANPASGFNNQKGLAYTFSSGKVEIATTADAPALEIGKNNANDGDLVSFRKQSNVVGSIGVSGGNNLFISGQAADHAGFTFATQSILPTTQGALNDNTVDLGQNGNGFKNAYISGGVYLGGVGAANKLDDYEEGTWTPSLEGSTTGGSHTYGYQNGKYTKVGNTVTASFGMYISTKDNTMNGNVLLSGLPVSASMGTNVFANLAIGWAANITYGDMLGGYINSGTSIALRLNNSAAAAGFLQSSAIGSGSVYLFGTITYQV